jgi:hypothetical protein
MESIKRWGPGTRANWLAESHPSGRRLSNAVNVGRTQGLIELRFTWPLFGGMSLRAVDIKPAFVRCDRNLRTSVEAAVGIDLIE